MRPAGAPMPAAAPHATVSDGHGASVTNGYYGRPLLKEPTWTWEVPLYFFVGGAAGAAAVVGAAARALGDGDDADLVRDARWVAALGGALSAPLLISDLGRPERFLNMLRVWKPQSPMSVGAWTLTAFGSSAGAAAFAELVGRRAARTPGSPPRGPVRVVGDAAQYNLPANPDVPTVRLKSSWSAAAAAAGVIALGSLLAFAFGGKR